MIVLPVRQAGGRLRGPAARLRGPAARLTGLILGAALLRTALLPFGDGISTAVFGVCLVGIAWPWRANAGARWGIGVSILAGCCLGLALLAPLALGPAGGRPLDGFWQWGSIAAVIAGLEELAIRGRLQQQWTLELGPVSAIVAGALVFAAIHLPRYGLAAMPLDFAVGLALGGLRALSGRVLPSAIAHVMADWGAWFWA